MENNYEEEYYSEDEYDDEKYRLELEKKYKLDNISINNTNKKEDKQPIYVIMTCLACFTLFRYFTK
jgi:hypothetical protein